MKKLLFVVNGHSGKGQIKNKLFDIIDIMIKEGYHVQVHTTQEREDATKVVREQAKYYDLVVCSGGDGTLDEAVTGMMQSEVRTPLGYIPAGSTNDFANSLEIPKDMIQAAKTAEKKAAKRAGSVPTTKAAQKATKAAKNADRKAAQADEAKQIATGAAKDVIKKVTEGAANNVMDEYVATPENAG